MEEVKKLRKERADREKRERAQKDEIQKLKNDKGAVAECSAFFHVSGLFFEPSRTFLTRFFVYYR